MALLYSDSRGRSKKRVISQNLKRKPIAGVRRAKKSHLAASRKP